MFPSSIPDGTVPVGTAGNSIVVSFPAGSVTTIIMSYSLSCSNPSNVWVPSGLSGVSSFL